MLDLEKSTIILLYMHTIHYNYSARVCVIHFYILQEVHGFTTVAELEKFLLEHGEHVVDVLGLEVDRMERAIKVCTAVADDSKW